MIIHTISSITYYLLLVVKMTDQEEEIPEIFITNNGNYYNLLHFTRFWIQSYSKKIEKTLETTDDADNTDKKWFHRKKYDKKITQLRERKVITTLKRYKIMAAWTKYGFTNGCERSDPLESVVLQYDFKTQKKAENFLLKILQIVDRHSSSISNKGYDITNTKLTPE